MSTNRQYDSVLEMVEATSGRRSAFTRRFRRMLESKERAARDRRGKVAKKLLLRPNRDA